MAIRKKSSQYQGTIVNADGEIVKAGDPSLVIDLPDGQKLIVGELPEGTILEVATWRGTGRPDSRANRLLLGVGSAQSFSPPQSQVRETEQDAVANLDSSNTQPIPKVGFLTSLKIKLSSIRENKEQARKIKREKQKDTLYVESVGKTESESIYSSNLDNYIEQLMSETIYKTSTTKKPAKKAPSKKKPAKKASAKKSRR
jgi:hypothetical protein